MRYNWNTCRLYLHQKQNKAANKEEGSTVNKQLAQHKHMAAEACLRVTMQSQHMNPYLRVDTICTYKNVSFPPVT